MVEINLFGRRSNKSKPITTTRKRIKKTPEQLSAESDLKVHELANKAVSSRITDLDDPVSRQIIESKLKMKFDIKKPSVKDRLEAELSSDVINAIKNDPATMQRYMNAQLDTVIGTIESGDIDEDQRGYYPQSPMSSLREQLAEAEDIAHTMGYQKGDGAMGGLINADTLNGIIGLIQSVLVTRAGGTPQFNVSGGNGNGGATPEQVIQQLQAAGYQILPPVTETPMLEHPKEIPPSVPVITREPPPPERLAPEPVAEVTREPEQVVQYFDDEGSPDQVLDDGENYIPPTDAETGPQTREPTREEADAGEFTIQTNAEDTQDQDALDINMIMGYMNMSPTDAAAALISDMQSEKPAATKINTLILRSPNEQIVMMFLGQYANHPDFGPYVDQLSQNPEWLKQFMETVKELNIG